MQKQNEIVTNIINENSPEQQIQTLVDGVIGRLNTIKLCRISTIINDGAKRYRVQNLVSRANAGGAEAGYDLFNEIYDAQEIGGNGGFVIERAVGDIVVVGFFDRESTQQLSNGVKGSLKSYAACPNTCGVILGAVFYSTPTVHIVINNTIEMTGETTLNGGLTHNGDNQTNGIITATGNITSGADVVAGANITAALNITAGGAVAGTTGTFGAISVPAPANFSAGGASLAFNDQTGFTHNVINGLIVS